MPEFSATELQQLVRRVFGRDLSAAQAEAYRGRLIVMAQAVELLQAWETRLRHSEPAAVHRTPAPEGESYGAV